MWHQPQTHRSFPKLHVSPVIGFQDAYGGDHVNTSVDDLLGGLLAAWRLSHRPRNRQSRQDRQDITNIIDIYIYIYISVYLFIYSFIYLFIYLFYFLFTYRRWTMQSSPCCIVVNPRAPKILMLSLGCALGTGGQKNQTLNAEEVR